MQNRQIKQTFGNTKLNLFTKNVQGTKRHTDINKKKKKKPQKKQNSNTWAKGVKVKTWAITNRKCILH